MTEDYGAGVGPDPAAADANLGNLVGTILADRYRIVERLGMGAMGAVYLGEHLRIGRKDAIKLLRASMARDPEAIARFTRGARNVSRIRHPNVCTLYDFGDTREGLHFVAMEYVDGPTLGGLLEKQGPLAVDRAARLIEQVGEALQAAHALGIIHRDLKPDNIMVARQADGSEVVKVVDFDIARGPAEEEGPAVTRHGFVVGTPEYMSPEQLTGDPLDGRSDVYSMALVFYRMVTGRLPFEGNTAQEVMIQRLTQEPMTLSQGAQFPFSPALEAAVTAGLRRRADERPIDARSFARGIVEAVRQPDLLSSPAPLASATGIIGTLEGAASPPPPPPPPATGSFEPGRFEEAPPAGSRWSPGLLVGLGLGALLLLGGGGIAAFLSMSEEPNAPSPRVEMAATPLNDAPSSAAAPVGAPAGDPVGGIAEAAAEPPASAPPRPPARDPDPPPTSRPSNPIPESRPVASPPAGIDPAQARDILFRQYVAQGENPSPARLRAARDTAQAIWDLPNVPTPERAFAAHILGLALIPLGDSIRGVDWLVEAARLDPIPRYTSVRDVHRRGGP